GSAGEIGGVDEGRAAGIELCHEDVVLATGEAGLERPRRCREVARGSGARHVGIAAGVHGDPAAAKVAKLAKEGGVSEHRIDNERPVGVIASHLEANPLRAFKNVAAFDLAPHTVDLLVDGGLTVAKRSP